MRSRTVREGSVGLLMLLGFAMFGALILWLRGIEFGKNSYRIVTEFANANGMQIGAPVRYRGVDVGRIIDIQPGSNGVDITIEISSADLLIPNNVKIEANQSGLIGESSISIIPLASLPATALNSTPFDENCQSTIIICNEDRLQGNIGSNFDDLIRSSAKFTGLYTQPEFYEKINTVTANAGVAAEKFAKLSDELLLLSKSVRKEMTTFSTTARSLTSTLDQTATQTRATLNQFSLTASQLAELSANVNSLVQENRGSLVTTLETINSTGNELQQLMASFAPAVDKVDTILDRTNTALNTANTTLNTANSTLEAANPQQLIQNLETLTANASEASANLRDITTGLNDPNTLFVLQQTLDSARATFENAQKITADLDELTGDPAFRDNLLRLVNGLSNLVSSTQQLEQQIQMAQALEPMNSVIQETALKHVQEAKGSEKSQRKN